MWLTGRKRSSIVWINNYIIIIFFVLFIIAKSYSLDTGSSSLFATGLMSDGKLGYEIVRFGFELIPEILVRQK